LSSLVTSSRGPIRKITRLLSPRDKEFFVITGRAQGACNSRAPVPFHGRAHIFLRFFQKIPKPNNRPLGKNRGPQQGSKLQVGILAMEQCMVVAIDGQLEAVWRASSRHPKRPNFLK
jgi:hypothetical protein